MQFVPETPRAGDDVSLAIDASDPDGQVLRIASRWSIEGRSDESNASRFVVPEESRGRMLRAIVTVDDGHGGSDLVIVSTPVANSPPVVAEVSLSPSGELTVANDIVAIPRANDRDGDDLSYQFGWRVNGRVLADGDATLPSRHFRRGDSVAVEVTAFDGIDWSEPLTSDERPIRNAPPRIVSSPEEIAAEKSLRYRVRANDPDGDRNLRFHLVRAPEGLSLDPMTGDLRWSPQDAQRGVHTVEIEVSDPNGGLSSQTIELRVGTSPVPAATP